MYQKCPVCDGYSSFVPQLKCKVCMGTGIISTIHGRPPYREDMMLQEPQKTEKPKEKAKKKNPIGFQLAKTEIKKVDEEIKLPIVKKEEDGNKEIKT